MHYHTALPPSDQTARQVEAAELLEQLDALVDREGLRRATAQICASREAAELREPPEQVLTFERDDGGTWVYTGESRQGGL